MSDIDHAAEVRALIAEARRYRRTVSRERSLLHRLADALEAAHAVAALTINGKAVTYNKEDGAWWAQSEGAPGWTAVANSRQELDALTNEAKSFIEAAHAEPDDAQNNRLVQDVIDAWRVFGRSPSTHAKAQHDLARDWPTLAKAVVNLAAGFRRSARVPVSRDELARWAVEFFGDDDEVWEDYVEVTDSLTDRFDIYPKADRKPADSSNGDDRDHS